jgi:S1-C subfamily serine protease
MKKTRKLSLWDKFYPLVIGCMLLVAYGISSCSSSQSENTDAAVKHNVVRILGEKGMCSGEQVLAASGHSYILTASHCRHLGDNGVYKVTDDDKVIHYAHFIAEDHYSDLLLLEGISDSGLTVASRLANSERQNTFTHGHNFDTYKTSGIALGERLEPVLISTVTTDEEAEKCAREPKYTAIETFPGQYACMLTVPMTVSTALVLPGSSGGPVVNSDGELTGVVSAGGSNLSLFVRLEDIKRFLQDY